MKKSFKTIGLACVGIPLFLVVVYAIIRCMLFLFFVHFVWAVAKFCVGVVALIIFALIVFVTIKCARRI